MYKLFGVFCCLEQKFIIKDQFLDLCVLKFFLWFVSSLGKLLRKQCTAKNNRDLGTEIPIINDSFQFLGWTPEKVIASRNK